MKTFFRHFKFAMFGVSLLCVALGVAILLWPDEARQIFCYAFGAVLILSGIFEVAAYLVGKSKGLLQKLMFVGGVVAAVIGVWVLFSPDKVLTLTVIVMGVVLLYHGVMDIKYAFDIKACDYNRWGAVMVLGLLTCGIGVLLLVNPFESVQVLFFIVAIGFLFDGLTGLFTVCAVAQGERRLELAGRKPTEVIEGTGEVVGGDAAAAGKSAADGSAPAAGADGQGKTPEGPHE